MAISPDEPFSILNGAFSVSGLDGTTIRIWLLSLLWRMGVSQAVDMVDLGAHSDRLGSILSGVSLNQLERDPVACDALSSEGK